MVGGSGTGTWRRMDNNCGEVSHPELLLLATPLLPVLLHVDNCFFRLNERLRICSFRHQTT